MAFLYAVTASGLVKNLFAHHIAILLALQLRMATDMISLREKIHKVIEKQINKSVVIIIVRIMSLIYHYYRKVCNL